MSPLREFLESIDPALCAYLDDADHLSIPATERAVAYAEKLIAGEMTFAQVHAEWRDWFPLVEAFVMSYEIEDIEDSLDFSPLGGPGLSRPTTPADLAFLESLADWLSVHRDLRREGEALGDW